MAVNSRQIKMIITFKSKPKYSDRVPGKAYCVMGLVVRKGQTSLFCETEDIDDKCFGGYVDLAAAELEVADYNVPEDWIVRGVGDSIVTSWPEYFSNPFLNDDASEGRSDARLTVKLLLAKARGFHGIS